ncbi:TylF/MycF/NovP-related O-methyltransferase [Pseudaestuariivita sp.]|uniref:TylF/MycF/NovP-related O-methyltransferase n=1 Tax=Pseudaestuariivita sp. TaxID=2211669 RepID=UPI004059DD57
MFYGTFKDEAQKQKFRDALKLFEQVFGPVFASDNLIGLQRTAGFRQDPAFAEAVRANAENAQERSLIWRLHSLVWAGQHALSLPAGDIVECGVWKGYSMGVLAHFLGFADVDRTMYLYDTFEGIPEAYNSEKRSNAVYEAQNRETKTIYDHCVERFLPYPNVRIVKGIVPDTFAEACPDQIALLHMDLNSSAAEIAALEVLFDRLVPGGIILFDDYGWTGYQSQKKAEDAWLAERGHHIMEMPTGQGLLIKH